MFKDIQIREPSIRDAKKLMDFINPMTEEKGIGLLINKKVSLKEEKDYLKGVIKSIKEHKAVFLIAEHENKIIANTSIELYNHKKSHVGVFGISISKGYRNKGLGTFLMKTIIDYAKEKLKGLEIIELEVFADNERAKHVYKKMGFKKTGIKPRVIKQGNKYVDEIIMYKEL